MSFIGNYSVFNKTPGRLFSGPSVSDNRCNWNTPGSSRSFYYQDSGNFNTPGGFINTHPLFFYGHPLGTVPPYSWIIPQKAGGMALRVDGSGIIDQTLIPQQPTSVNFTGTGSMASAITGLGNVLCAFTGSSTFTASSIGNGNIVITANGSGGLTATILGNGNISISLTGSGTLSGPASLFLNMICAMTGSGTLSADAALLVSMLCSMTGASTMTASIVGLKQMDASFTGTGSLSGNIVGFANMISNLLGSGTLTEGMQAVANMSMDIVVTGTGLSTANVGQAVWESILSMYNADPNSAAAKLLGASSAGDPWSTSLPAAYTGTQAGNILAQILTLVDELHKIEGLSNGVPMVVTQTNRTAGTINLDITGDGENITTVNRND